MHIASDLSTTPQIILGCNQYWAGWVYVFCGFMSGSEGSTGSGSGFMSSLGEPGIELRTPGYKASD